jgi:predicted pyridoxine 5'-phosphate oxidase superfamily flavin-nucleotide-binding protein
MNASTTRAPIFHAGEVALQNQAGVAERMARVAPQAIREHMPEQHRAFFPTLPFVIVGSVDEHGQPTASLLAAPPGFAWSPDPRTLRLDTLPFTGDPLAQNLRTGAPLGLLGMRAHERRRNRVNGNVIDQDHVGFSLGVRQSFGNCPKYIHAREAFYVGTPPAPAPEEAAPLAARERALVVAADTFFIASAHPAALTSSVPSEGVDVSHRGGPAGFAAFTDDETFVIADYRGNDLYMTLGNLQLSSLAGLLFIDRQSGDLLQLEATTDVIEGTHPQPTIADTGRLVRFRVQRARRFPATSPLRFGAEE